MVLYISYWIDQQSAGREKILNLIYRPVFIYPCLFKDRNVFYGHFNLFRNAHRSSIKDTIGLIYRLAHISSYPPWLHSISFRFFEYPFTSYVMDTLLTKRDVNYKPFCSHWNKQGGQYGCMSIIHVKISWI